MPLGEGYTAEEQITGEGEHGGLQIVVYPMKAEVYKKHFEQRVSDDLLIAEANYCMDACLSMGLAPGGLMRQEIYEDPFGLDAWDFEHGSRCFVHLVNSLQYYGITGHQPPQQPPTAHEYTKAGLPWFEYYSDAQAVAGSGVLAKMKGIAAKAAEKDGATMQENDSVTPTNIKKLSQSGVVQEGEF